MPYVHTTCSIRLMAGSRRCMHWLREPITLRQRSVRSNAGTAACPRSRGSTRAASRLSRLSWHASRLSTRGFAVRTCRSELIYFRKGGEAQLPATIEGTRVVLVPARRQGRAEPRRHPQDRAGILAGDRMGAAAPASAGERIRSTVRGRVVGHRERSDHRSRRRIARTPRT